MVYPVTKTKAAILYELNRPLVIEEIDIPGLKPGQVLVKILYSGVCRAQYNEMIGLKGPDKFLPHLMGHEASAIVEDVGAGITKVKPGDYVALSWIKGDGLDGINAHYHKGDTVINAGGVTTFSEYSVVSENRVTKIDPRMPADMAAILGCAIVTGCGIIENTAHVQRGQSVVVFGAGGIGASVILGAVRRGCDPIFAVDIFDSKLQAAAALGATHIINPNDGSALDAILAVCPDGVDCAVDASGHKLAMEAAFAAIRPGGICVIAGNMPKDERLEIHPFELIKGKRLVGTWGGETVPQRDIPLYVEAYLDGQLPLESLVTHRLQLDQVNTAFDLLQSGQAGRILLEINPC